jgi:CHAT domain-containing protein
VVVLASCASAESFEVRELGSLAAAFLASGSQAVVASLWAIDDGAAEQFSAAFYQDDGARDPLHAVAFAQRQMLADGAPIESWAAFVVIGEVITPHVRKGSLHEPSVGPREQSQSPR